MKLLLVKAPPLLHAPISLSNEGEALVASTLAQAASPGSRRRRTAVEDAIKSHTQSYTQWDIVFARVFDYTDS